MATLTADRIEPAGLAPGEKRRITVGVSDLAVSRDADVFLITYSLGPCIGLVVHDPAVRAGAILHYQLPASRGHDARAKANPFMFADTGIPILLERIYGLGARRERMRVSVFGGASMMQDENIFKIGIQNARAARKVLWQQCVPISNEEVGGKSSRTVSLDIASGEIRLRSEGGETLYR